MNDAAEMPRYRSHKVVWALEIKAFEWATKAPQGGWLVTPADVGYGDVRLPAEVFSRYTPKPGDFIVQYDDGYWSVSPRKVFIESYTPLADRPHGTRFGAQAGRTPVSTVIERMAHALWLKAQSRDSFREERFFKEDARAAIEAARTPDPSAVLRVAHETGIAPATIDLCWTRLNDEALK